MKPIDIIFNRLFKVKVPVLATYTEMDMELVGLPASYDAKAGLQNQSVTELNDVYLTINDMLEIYKKGFDILVDKQEDVDTIYKSINDHLLMWAKYGSHGPNRIVIPEEDLSDLDRFAAEIFNNNKIEIVNGTIHKVQPFGGQMGIKLIELNGPKVNNTINYDEMERASLFESKNKDVDLNNLNSLLS